jgi:hypothetical protein
MSCLQPGKCVRCKCGSAQPVMVMVVPNPSLVSTFNLGKAYPPRTSGLCLATFCSMTGSATSAAPASLSVPDVAACVN